VKSKINPGLFFDFRHPCLFDDMAVPISQREIANNFDLNGTGQYGADYIWDSDSFLSRFGYDFAGRRLQQMDDSIHLSDPAILGQTCHLRRDRVPDKD
jgi:hypothetical protein